ncbi:hypothetical protein ACQKQD_31410 [Methylobacterium sp. NPDC080182]|uniref:hypothetical protein n=1 Tax=Methylobacterium sp. NPDC080182 TaxID=3390590 RepID=UPI003D032ADE
MADLPGEFGSDNVGEQAFAQTLYNYSPDAFYAFSGTTPGSASAIGTEPSYGTGYDAYGTTAYDRSDASRQGGYLGTVLGGAIGADLGGPAGASVGGPTGSYVGQVSGGYLYDAFTQPVPVPNGDYGTPSPGNLDPYTGVGP